MAKIKRIVEIDDNGGWSDWIPPTMNGYRMVCCDCGLAHDLQFSVIRVRENGSGLFTVLEDDVPGMRVIFRAKRNARSTAQVRRHR